MKKWTIVVAVGACLAVCMPAFARKHIWPGVCSAFNAKGDSGAATITPGLVSIDITYSTGRVFRLSASEPGLTRHEMLEGTGSCNAFFSSDGTYLAIAVNKGELQGGTFQGLYFAKVFGIVVANLKTKKIVGNFSIKPEGPLRAPLLVVGFLLDQPTLVVLGAGPGPHPEASYSEVVLSFDGKHVQPPELRSPPKGWLPSLNTVDSKHNRLWLYNPSSECKLRPAALAGTSAAGLPIEEPKGMCDEIGYLAFPDAGTIIGVGGGDYPYVMTLDVATAKPARVNLPHARGNLTSVNGALLSPDGKVFAAVRRLTSTMFFGGALEQGYRLDFFQVSPLALIGKLRLGSSTDQASISIDHRNGAVKVLSYNGHKWQFHHVKIK